MLFVLYALDRPDRAKLRGEHRAGHLAFLKAQKERILAAGPLLSDDKEKEIGALLIGQERSANRRRRRRHISGGDDLGAGPRHRHADLRGRLPDHIGSLAG